MGVEHVFVVYDSTKTNRFDLGGRKLVRGIELTHYDSIPDYTVVEDARVANNAAVAQATRIAQDAASDAARAAAHARQALDDEIRQEWHSDLNNGDVNADAEVPNNGPSYYDDVNADADVEPDADTKVEPNADADDNDGGNNNAADNDDDGNNNEEKDSDVDDNCRFDSNDAFFIVSAPLLFDLPFGGVTIEIDRLHILVGLASDGV
jgi:hypothetical protein